MATIFFQKSGNKRIIRYRVKQRNGSRTISQIELDRVDKEAYGDALSDFVNSTAAAIENSRAVMRTSTD
jgi:hypothetical protein